MSREAVDILERVLFSCQRSPFPVTTKKEGEYHCQRQAVTLLCVLYCLITRASWSYFPLHGARTSETIELSLLGTRKTKFFSRKKKATYARLLVEIKTLSLFSNGIYLHALAATEIYSQFDACSVSSKDSSTLTLQTCDLRLQLLLVQMPPRSFATEIMGSRRTATEMWKNRPTFHQEWTKMCWKTTSAWQSNFILLLLLLLLL